MGVDQDVTCPLKSGQLLGGETIAGGSIGAARDFANLNQDCRKLLRDYAAVRQEVINIDAGNTLQNRDIDEVRRNARAMNIDRDGRVAIGTGRMEEIVDAVLQRVVCRQQLRKIEPVTVASVSMEVGHRVEGTCMNIVENKGIRACATGQDILAIAAAQSVRSCAADKRVISAIAKNHVIAAVQVHVNHVVSIQPKYDIGTVGVRACGISVIARCQGMLAGDG